MKCLLLVVFGLAALCSATQVNQCPNEHIADLESKVSIGACNKPPCRLRKNTKVPLTFKFQPEFNFKNLTQVVNANLLGIPFPFVGVDGTTACDKIYEEDEKTKNNCQFQKGKSYVFKNTIDVLQIYPRVKTVVHWSLTDPQTGKNAICFEVPARITN
ncbi:NPC intracellular cholesterol transporter 2 [Dendroctonus ponderosae]|uniref:MD-2-related lipid-recognition domain-containing protein n=2 Tax=Dendroctonus ponderosae TaxID=77166 RepID=A0AAR5QCX4_DENPD|nr:NPC intracellular cholesterol transporter 2 [Dendroctonus ponderosae]